MTFWKGLKTGINNYSKGFKFIFHHHLGYYFLFPLLLNIALFILGYVSILSLSSHFFTIFSSWTHMDSWEFWGAGFISKAILIILHLVIRILFIITFAYTGGYSIVIILSPVYACLSEKTEKILTGNDYPFSFIQFIKDIWRGIMLAIRNFAIEMILTIGLFILSFIPLVGLFTGITLFIITSYFYGFSFIDYSLERRKMDLKTSVSFVKENKGIAIGNGLIFAFILLIPYIGVLLSGFISIISVVAATISTIECCVKNNKNNVLF